MIIHLITAGKKKVRTIEKKTVQGIINATRGLYADVVVVHGSYDETDPKVDSHLRIVASDPIGDVIYIGDS